MMTHWSNRASLRNASHHRHAQSLVACTLTVGWAGAFAPASEQAAGSEATERPGSGVIEVRNGEWYDGTGFAPQTFFIEDGLLYAEPSSLPDSVLDLRGGFVIPPFGDAHTHNLDGPFDLDRVRDAYVEEGTFYVSVLTNTATGAAKVRSRFNQPCELDVLYANGGLTSTLSHPFLAYEPRAMGLFGDWASSADQIRASRIREDDAYWFIDSVDDLDEKWPRIVAARPDILKVFLLDAREAPPDTAGVGLPHGHGLRPSLVAEIVRRARELGVQVAAHVETAADFEAAIDGGVGLAAHMPGYAYGTDGNGRAVLGAPTEPFLISDAVAERAGRLGVAVTPTVAWTYAGGGPDSSAAVVERQALMKRNLETLRSHGVRILVGSDWFGQTGWHEIKAMIALGVFTPAELLEAWAVHTPQWLFPDRPIGALQPGFEASFLVLGANPLEGFDAVKDIHLRVKQGCVVG